MGIDKRKMNLAKYLIRGLIFTPDEHVLPEGVLKGNAKGNTKIQNKI